MIKYVCISFNPLLFSFFFRLFLFYSSYWQTIQSKINVLSDSNQYKVQQNELNRKNRIKSKQKKAEDGTIEWKKISKNAHWNENKRNFNTNLSSHINLIFSLVKTSWYSQTLTLVPSTQYPEQRAQYTIHITHSISLLLWSLIVSFCSFCFYEFLRSFIRTILPQFFTLSRVSRRGAIFFFDSRIDGN